MKKNLLIGLMLALLSNNVWAQKERPNEILNNSTVMRFERFIRENYAPDSGKLKLLCENSCIFAKFKVSLSGKIVDLSFNRDVPPIISDALVNVFRKAEIDKRSILAFRSKQRVYLLPIVYYYDDGCYAAKKQNEVKLANHDSTATIIDEEQQGIAIYHILQFSNKTYDTLGCTILKPIEINKRINN